MKELFLVISIAPNGEKNVVCWQDDDGVWREVLYTFDAAIDVQQQMYKDFLNTEMRYHIKRITL